MNVANPKEPKFDLRPLDSLDDLLAPCEGVVPYAVLFTIKQNLLVLIYEQRCEAVRDFHVRIRKR